MFCKVGVDKYSGGHSRNDFLHIRINYLISVFLMLLFVFFNRHRARTGFDKSSLERLEQLFRKTVGNEKEIKREDFKKIVTSKNVRFYLKLHFS